MKKIFALVLSLMLAFVLVACGSNGSTTTENKAEATTLTGSAAGYDDKTVEVTVTKEGDKITKVEVNADSQTPEIGGEAAKKLAEAIVAKGTVEGVEVVSGATLTSEAVLKAVKEAK